jgi:hypothetical protein
MMMNMVVVAAVMILMNNENIPKAVEAVHYNQVSIFGS